MATATTTSVLAEQSVHAQIVDFIINAFTKEHYVNIRDDMISNRNPHWPMSAISYSLDLGVRLGLLTRYTLRQIGDTPFSGSESVYAVSEQLLVESFDQLKELWQRGEDTSALSLPPATFPLKGQDESRD